MRNIVVKEEGFFFSFVYMKPHVLPYMIAATHARVVGKKLDIVMF